jgi:hypothetical protein
MSKSTHLIVSSCVSMKERCIVVVNLERGLRGPWGFGQIFFRGVLWVVRKFRYSLISVSYCMLMAKFFTTLVCVHGNMSQI